MAYNSDPIPLTLETALGMNSNLRQNALTRYFEQQATQHNALASFTSAFDTKTMGGGGPRSIFCDRTDLSKGGGQTVYFNVIGIPAGPGVRGGAGELTGNTSQSRMGAYPVHIDWLRDAFELTEDEVEILAAGADLEQTIINLLAHKMGLAKQNQMLKRLIDDANGNIYRPNSRANTDALQATDFLDLDVTTEARARLQTMGAKPLMRNVSKAGCPVDKYLVFGTSSAMLTIRNNTDFQTAISNFDTRGEQNALVTGEILKWQGNPFYEFPVTDQDWDDFLGGPLIAKAIISEYACTVTADNTASGGAAPSLISNASNTKSLYFQWFDGIPYFYNRVETLGNFSAKEYYGWACNPDGSRCFVSYQGIAVAGGGNRIVIKNILAPAAGTSGKGAATVGRLTFGTTGMTISGKTITALGSEATVPANNGPNGPWVYKTEIQPGAVFLQANRDGVPYSRSFVLGSMAACYAHGRIKMTGIEQKRDFGHIHGNGYKMIYGTGTCKNTLNRPSNYLMVEHAIVHPGYAVPSYEAP